MKYFKLPILTAAVTSVALLGCANSSNTQKGAGIGAVIGAVAGKATGDHDKSRYAWGAAIGAIAGSAIGAYMDQQEQAFKKELADSGVDVVRDGDQLKLIMPGNLTFDSGSSIVKSNFHPILNDVAVVLKKFDKTKLSIEGHTDSTGDALYNQSLSEARANSVAHYLSQQNVADQRLRTIGMGESSPVASNQTAAARSQNRRVELRIIPVAK
ncbi:OmpA/MotB domain-containing protein [Catenovulum agarivorans DS-2]|uniref:OmpA/MotB domain-containing protein n=1 Tax=Catenovulum agarivorans DS-2 TaxID=1328313 RepID=W7QG10_9ALTE|nr:OmpA family protein [Catenovulum agarivorans]EWH10836.1 OmpA/MotB domain-containing protein [Catenovulum agarivorans DS-2]